MKKIVLAIFSIIFALTIFPVVEAKNFNDLTSYQKQKYWVYIKECSPLLLNKEYNKYRICALAAFEKALQEKETNAWCTDSDGGKDFLTKGIVKTDIYPEGKEDYVKTFSNSSTYLMEGFCSSKNQYAFAQKKCSDFGKKYYAKDGACVYENQPPVLTIAVNTTEINEGDYYEIYLYGSDADNDNLTFSAENLPEGAEINEVAPVPFPYDKEVAIFSWMPNYEQAGEYTINFSISDGEKATSVTTTIIVQNVNQAPVLDEIGDKTILEGEELSFDLIADDPDGDVLVFSAQNLPEGAILNGNTFSWAPNYEQAGEYEITFTVSDGNMVDSELSLISVIKAGCPGNSWYISNVGSDDNDGSAVNPFATIQYGMEMAESCDKVIVTNGTYDILNIVQIGQDISLIIEPSVTIRFAKGSGLLIGGELIAIGTEEEKIIFTSSQLVPMPGDWEGIDFIYSSNGAVVDENGNYKSGSIIENSKIEYATTGLDLNKATPFISNDEILNSLYVGIFALDSKNVYIVGNKINGGINYGISSQNSSLLIKNNTIENFKYGTFLYLNSSGSIEGNIIRFTSLVGLYVDQSHFDIITNDVVDNEKYGIQMKSSPTNIIISIEGNSVDNNWMGIYNDCSSMNIIGNTFSGNTYGAIKTYSCSGFGYSVIQNNIILNNPGAAILGGGKLIENNIISNNGSGINGGGDILHNTITNNKGRGIDSVYGPGGSIKWNILNGNIDGIYINGLYEEISFNNILDSSFHFTVPGPSILNAINNYWGTTDPFVIDEKIYDINDDIKLGEVLYKPIAVEPFVIN